MATGLKFDLRQLHSFITIADRGSFSSASEALLTAQPALSRQIRLLEEGLGTDVFVRYGRGVVLTSAGELLYQRSKRLLQDLHQMQAEVAALSGEVTGHVAFGLLPTVSHGVASAIVGEFKAQYPKVSLAVRSAMSGTLQQMVSQNKIDLAITYDQKRSNSLTYTPLLEERFYLITPPNTHVSERESISLEEVVSLPMILPEEKHGLRMRMETEAAKIGKSLNLAFEVSAWPMLSEMVKRNLDYTVLSSVSVDDLVNRGEVKAIPIVEPEVYRPIAIVTRSGTPPSIATQKLIDIVIRRVEYHVEHGDWKGRLLFPKSDSDPRKKG